MPGSPADPIWIHAAARLGIPVVRGGDAYVHFDGQRLVLAEDSELDDDDSLAQLILHELCHLLVEGPGARHLPDWGLLNQPSDAPHEDAAVRLQAHLLGAYGLRGRLYPTTPVRALFDALPPEALGPATSDDPSVALARRAAERAARWPFDPTLTEALEATARLWALPVHPASGAPVVATDDLRRCGSCSFRAGNGLCRRSEGRAYTSRDARACTRHEAALDCLDCGACCRAAFDSVEFGARERPRGAAIERLVQLRTFVVGDRGRPLRSLRRVSDPTDHFDTEARPTRCAALVGAAAGPYRCSVYEERPHTCRDFTRGSRNCLSARRRVGLSV
jgi:Fe-S-cluster containining protein